MPNPSFDEQLILGTVVGDTWLDPGRQGRAVLNHCAAQTDWLLYKAAAFQRQGWTPTACRVRAPYGDARQFASWVYLRPPNPAVSHSLLRLTRSRQGRILPFRLVPLFGAVALAAWIMDDGCRTDNGFRLCVSRYEPLEAFCFAAAFSAHWHLPTPGIAKDGASLLYRKQDSRLLRAIWRVRLPSPPPSVIKKLGLGSA